MSPSVEILQGTLDLLVLKTLALEPMHGWGIAQRIQQVSREVLQIQQGSLYPALFRLERKRLISAEWGASENNRRAKYYSLTKAGREQLGREMADWDTMSAAVALILQRV
jgi:PadR family transcriptional regulator PadR